MDDDDVDVDAGEDGSDGDGGDVEDDQIDDTADGDHDDGSWKKNRVITSIVRIRTLINRAQNTT